MGLWCNPRGQCLGLRPLLAAYLPAKYPNIQIVPAFESYASDVVALARSVPQFSTPKPSVILIGHSKGGKTVERVSNILLATHGGHVESLIEIEPVDVLPDFMDGPAADFDTVQGVGVQRCFYSTEQGYFGHKCKDESLNVGLPYDHVEIVSAPEVEAYVESEIVRWAT